ncbi:hypothetical protein, partial [Enterobacter hormaechei]|uniref:hypothetical protein n=1 Tax=Enterobacter hormaechei TaxID=158836 RepID=UPI0013D52ECB
ADDIASFFNPTRAIYMPVSADGSSIKNRFGVLIATATNAAIANAMAELVNLRRKPAVQAEQIHEAREHSRNQMLRARISNRKKDRTWRMRSAFAGTTNCRHMSSWSR